MTGAPRREFPQSQAHANLGGIKVAQHHRPRGVQSGSRPLHLPGIGVIQSVTDGVSEGSPDLNSMKRPRPPRRICESKPTSRPWSSRSTALSRGSSAREPSIGHEYGEDEASCLADIEEIDEMRSYLGLHTEEDQRCIDTGRRTPTSTSASRSTTTCSSLSGETETDERSECSIARALKCEDPWDTLRGPQRAHHELQQWSLPPNTHIESSPGSSAQFFYTVDVAEGPFTPASLTFWIKVFEDFPADGSCGVRCTKRIFHPSVDPSSCKWHFHGDDGGVGFPALLLAIRKSVCTPESSPANAVASTLLQTDPDEFRRVVRTTLNGGEHGGVRYDRTLVLGRSSSSMGGESKIPGKPSTPLHQQEFLKVEMMKIEVLRDELKSKVDVMQHENSVECRGLE